MIGNMQEAKARGGSIIALTTTGNDTLSSILDRSRDFVLEIPRTPELLMPIVMVVPLQLLAYYDRRPPRVRRRSAEESREVGDGRIDRGWRLGLGAGEDDGKVLPGPQSLASSP